MKVEDAVSSLTRTLASDPRLNSAPPNFNPEKDLPSGFLEAYLPLHKRFTPRQQEIILKRKQVLQQSHQGSLPNHLPPSSPTQSEWKITVPEWCQDQRNQMTGPADEAELVVKMLNSGAPGVMLDLEDSIANYWPNLELGIANVLEALRGQLTYFDKKRDRKVEIAQSKTVIFTRARGLHLTQKLPGLPPINSDASMEEAALTSASLYDVCRVAFAVDPKALKHPLCFYIPKSESAEEAKWWNDLFKEISRIRGWEPNYIKCMALVESHPQAYQMEEFLYNLRDHIIGLNLGRWDYMASLAHFNLQDPAWILPDRNTIPSDVKFFQNLRELIPSICHRRGCLAIGGMTALFPDRTNPELNTRALTVLAKDKKNEADCGMDGAWTGHPDQNQIAVEQFPNPNQIQTFKAKLERYPDLRPSPVRVGQRTLAGTRAAARTVIRYRNGVLNGKGASLLDGYMEDLATDRIYRVMISQRMLHRDKANIVDEQGKAVIHTPELVTKIFNEELDRILRELPAGSDATVADKYREARKIGERMIVQGEFDPV